MRGVDRHSGTEITATVEDSVVVIKINYDSGECNLTPDAARAFARQVEARANEVTLRYKEMEP